MTFDGDSITQLIRRRFSCRSYTGEPIEPRKRQLLERFLAAEQLGPLGTPARFRLIRATEEDRSALRGLGTYGFIRGATGYILGVVRPGEKHPEDFGYLAERIVLYATHLDLGTCWLGGTFTKSSFAARAELEEGEVLPAVIAVGHSAGQRGVTARLVRRFARSDSRLPWEQLFFDGQFGAPLPPEEAGLYAEPLEMLRLGPSASNKQPWRVLREGGQWHFFLQRTPGYARRVDPYVSVDLQRVDLGIALCHFGLTAEELGLPGRWAVDEPAIPRPDRWTEYVASWREL